jgi:hypothetical protein
MIVATRGAGAGALTALLEYPTNNGSTFAVSSGCAAEEDKTAEEENASAV